MSIIERWAGTKRKVMFKFLKTSPNDTQVHKLKCFVDSSKNKKSKSLININSVQYKSNK